MKLHSELVKPVSVRERSVVTSKDDLVCVLSSDVAATYSCD